jgi:beta-galactosidase/beta-glucuronidase
LSLAGIVTNPAPGLAAPPANPPAAIILSGGWQLQDAAKVPQSGAEVSMSGFHASGWYAATVPGTVLTTLVNNRVYPEPLYGENNRLERIPESLARTPYWYRTSIKVPKAYKGRHIWLNFAGVNYAATVWVNGTQAGTMRGAFARGVFDITTLVKPGKSTGVAVLVSPQPHPGTPHEHTIRTGMGLNGGETAIDGPTFLSTIGWDWLPAIRDRDTGIWREVYLSASGSVLVKDPLVTTDLPLPRTDSSDLAVQTTVQNVTDQPVKGVLHGDIESIHFEREVELAPHSSQLIRFDPGSTPMLHMEHPRLWWPNGYGEQNLYNLHLSFVVDRHVSDVQNVSFGVRKITYTVPGTDTLTLSVNGVPVFIRGGDWGLDEGLKRIPRERLEAQIRMHKIAHLNMIRNWVGQSTNEDFYELCDKYGILIWDEFFQPNPSDGPNPTDIDTYIANVRDKILHFRNHPSIAVWCARNEGDPPAEIEVLLRKLMAELEPTRLYQPSSTDGHGVRSNGPYCWRTPREFYFVGDDYFKTETGSVSIPTLESIHGMMPQKDWETINDDWAEHDLAAGASHGDLYPGILAARYGKLANLADFVRKGQMANYEAYRSMYEGRNAQLFHPTTAILTWMSNPAQPSFVWQLYHYDLEPNASLYAVMHAAESVHIQYNEATGDLQVINNLPEPQANLTARVRVFALDGTLAYQHETPVTAEPEVATNLGPIAFAAAPAASQFLRLDLVDAQDKTISTNFYWRGAASHPDDLTDLNTLPTVTLKATASRQDADHRRIVTVTLENPTAQTAVMTHLQLRRRSGERVLPVDCSDNYISLAPHETRIVTLAADIANFQGENALITVDGWNVSAAPQSFKGVSVAPNFDAQPEHSPVTGLPFATENLR